MACHALAGDRAAVCDLKQGQVAPLGLLEKGERERMAGVLLQAGGDLHQASQLGMGEGVLARSKGTRRLGGATGHKLGGTCQQLHGHDQGPAQGEGAGFVEQDRAQTCRHFDRIATAK